MNFSCYRLWLQRFLLLVLGILSWSGQSKIPISYRKGKYFTLRMSYLNIAVLGDKKLSVYPDIHEFICKLKCKSCGSGTS